MQPQAYHSSNPNSELQLARKENDLLQKKLSKAICKRNYYAKLYYSCMLERDKAMAEREGALKELHKVLIQLYQQGHNLSPASDSLSDVSRLISDSSSGSNPTPLNPSRSISLASLLSSFHSHPSPSLHSPVEDSGLCTGGSTSSLNDVDNTVPMLEGTLNDRSTQPTGIASDVTNLLEECAEALEGIADLRLEISTKRVPLNDNTSKYEQDVPPAKLPLMPPTLAKLHLVPPTLAIRPRKASNENKPTKRNEAKFVDTFEMEPGAWSRSDREERALLSGNLESIPTSILEEYAQDSSSLSWSAQSRANLPSADPRRSLRNQSSKLDRIEEMSCESSHSDNSLDQKGKEQTKVHAPLDMFNDQLGTSLTERTDSAQKRISYSNLTTQEFRQILFQLSTSRNSVSYLEFSRSSFEDEWVLLLLCDEIRRNKSLRNLYLIECALYMAADNLVQLMTAVAQSRLECFSLARNGLTDEIVDTLQVTEFFNLDLPLILLDLSENFLSPEAVNLLISLSQHSKCEIKIHTQYTLTPKFNSDLEIL